jgi:hypothetical protein
VRRREPLAKPQRTGLALGGDPLRRGVADLHPTRWQALAREPIGTDPYRVQPDGPTLAPTWEQPIVIDRGRWPASEVVAIFVRDAVDQGVIAQHLTTLGQLLARDNHNLAIGGGVCHIMPFAKR